MKFCVSCETEIEEDVLKYYEKLKGHEQFFKVENFGVTTFRNSIMKRKVIEFTIELKSLEDLCEMVFILGKPVVVKQVYRSDNEYEIDILEDYSEWKCV